MATDSGYKTSVISIFYGVRGYNPKMTKHYSSILSYSISDQARFRLEVITHFDKFGLDSTKQAFKLSKATVYRWRNSFKKSKGILSSLVPKRKTPITKRQMQTNPIVLKFIKDQRQQHSRLGKRKIKPELDRFCTDNNLSKISTSTIGKIIKRNNFFFQKQGRSYHDPSSKFALRKLSYKTRVKKSPSAQIPGYVEIDTITLFTEGIKRYVYHALDIQNKFDFAYTYKNLNSSNTVDFIKKMELVYPLETGIHTIQSDNGLEFQGDFKNYTKQRKIKQLFIYPRCPKINGFIERANRSLKEEFINSNLYQLATSLEDFNKDLIQHLLWYNTTRPHQALNDISPINYLLKRYPESQMSVTRTLI